MTAQGIGREMAKGTGWMISARLSVQGIGALSTLVLARLLVPADFGLVALASAVSAALLAISEFSFDVVLIQNQRADRTHYDTAWTLSVLRNAILALCLAAGAGVMAEALDDARLEHIIYWIALSTLMDGFQNIGIVDFRKNLAFHKDLLFTVISKLSGFLVTVPFAFLWRDYWALIAGMVASALVRVVLTFVMHPYRPRLALTCWREIMHVSKWLVLNNVCGFFFHRTDTFVIGKLVGAQAVGVYNVAYDMANLATSNLVAPIRRAIFPGYAKVSEHLENLQRAYIQVFALVMLVGTPIAIGIGIVANPFVHVALGPQWVGSIPLMQVLSLYGLCGLISTGSAPVYLALARPHYIMWVMGATTVVMIPALIVACTYAGALGVAWAVAGSGALGVVADFCLVLWLLRLPVTSLLRAAFRPAVAAILMAGAVLAVEALWPAPQSVAQWGELLIVCVATAAITYVLSVLALWLVSGHGDGAEKMLLAELQRWIARYRIGRYVRGRP